MPQVDRALRALVLQHRKNGRKALLEDARPRFGIGPRAASVHEPFFDAGANPREQLRLAPKTRRDRLVIRKTSSFRRPHREKILARGRRMQPQAHTVASLLGSCEAVGAPTPRAYASKRRPHEVSRCQVSKVFRSLSGHR